MRKDILIKRILIYSLGVFFLTGCSPGTFLFHSRTHSDELEKGIYYFQRSDFFKSRFVLKHLVETQIGTSDLEEAEWYLALISEKLDSPEIAAQNHRIFLKNFPSSPHKKESEERIEAIDQKLKTSGEKKESQIKTSHAVEMSDELKTGIQYIQQGDFIQARTVFNRIIATQNGSPLNSEEAHWYLALISEKLDQPEIARQSYRNFLQNYPSTLHKEEAEERVRAIEQRAHLLPADHEKETRDKKESPVKSFSSRKGPDRVSGVLITEYLYDQTLSPDPAMNTQSRLSEFLDVRWRKGTGPDLRAYFSAMNVNDFLRSQNSRERLNKLFLEGNNIGWFSNFRIGRQPSTGSTLFNRFDGLSFSLPISPLTWTNNFGIPVDIFARDPLAIQSDKKFYETYLSVTDFYHITGRIYLTQEYFQDFSTRKAAGFNGFWSYDTLNIAMLYDRDIDFNANNDGMISFDYTQSKYHYSGQVEYRRNPFLDAGNALSSSLVLALTPPVTSLDVLQQMMPRDQIMQLALNNSQSSLDYSLGLSTDFSSIWRADFRYGRTLYNPVDLSGHLLTFPFVDSQKNIDRYSVFILERNLFNQNDIASALFLYQPGTDSTSTSAIANILKSWSNGITGGLRFRYEEASFASSGSSLTRSVPGFILRFTSKRGIEASLEGDYVMEQNSLSPDWNNTIQTRTSLSIPF